MLSRNLFRCTTQANRMCEARVLHVRLLSCLHNTKKDTGRVFLYRPSQFSSLQKLEAKKFSTSLLAPAVEKSQIFFSKLGTMVETTRCFSVNAPDNNIQYRIAPPSRYDDVAGILYSSFFTDEPMSRILKLTDGVSKNPVLDEFVYAGLEENLTIIAIDGSSGKLLGACVNVTATRCEDTLEQYIEKYKDDSFRHIMHVLHNVNNDAGDVFEEMGADILFDIKMVVTDKHNRKGGLATDLLRRSVELAKCLGFKGIKTEATGLYSRKAFMKLGFEVKAECVYEDFTTIEGEKIFVEAKDPHGCTTLMTKKI